MHGHVNLDFAEEHHHQDGGVAIVSSRLGKVMTVNDAIHNVTLAPAEQQQRV